VNILTINFNSIQSVVPIGTSNNFDIYSSGLYNTMRQSYLSPYENYNEFNFTKRLLQYLQVIKILNLNSITILCLLPNIYTK